jgi:hypothetical protein
MIIPSKKNTATLVVILTALGIIFLFHVRSTNEARAEVLSLYEEFQRLLESGRFELAYGYMTEDYRERESLENFSIVFGSLASEEYKDKKNMGIKIRGNYAEICPTSQKRWFGMQFLGTSFILVKKNNEWLFTGYMASYLD